MGPALSIKEVRLSADQVSHYIMSHVIRSSPCAVIAESANHGVTHGHIKRFSKALLSIWIRSRFTYGCLAIAVGLI